MSEDATYAALTEIFREAFGDDGLVLRPELTAQDVDGWDSFKQIEIVIAVEQRFRIKLPSREVDNLRCVGDLVRLIESRRLAG